MDTFKPRVRIHRFLNVPKHGGTIRKPLMAQTFSVTVLVYEDGTLAVTGSDITGLIIEVRTCDELLVELPRVASDLLRLNHGLTDE